MTPFKSLVFRHSRLIDEEKKPMLCIVTKIARGTVYYRPVSGGGVDCCPVEEFSKWVSEK